ncbi:MAG: TolC family protein [Rhodoferax sp.]
MKKKFKRLFAGAVLIGSVSAQAMDLLEAWQATAQHDPQAAVSQASRQAGQTRKEQAASLWRPAVMLSATAGRMNSETEMTGAHFSAPGFGTSDGVGFASSINNGNSSRWALSARQPLLNPERKAQSRQLEISVEVSELEWQVAQQDLMLQTAQRYFGVVLADNKLALLREQQKAVDLARVEAKDRFSLGDKPVTDTYEASARAHVLQAQVLSAQDELALALNALTDATGVPNPSVQGLPPASNVVPSSLQPLPYWLAQAMDKNLFLRMQAANLQVSQQELAKYSAAGATTLDLVAQAGRDQLSGNGNFGSASNTASQQMIGLQLNVPLYTGGYRSARQDEALRLQEKASAELERARQQISQQTRTAWLGIQTGSSRLTALGEAHKASLARLDATRLGRQVGDRTTLDLLQAENDASSAELSLLQARVDLLLSQLRLHALSGDLNEPKLEVVNALLQR